MVPRSFAGIVDERREPRMKLPAHFGVEVVNHGLGEQRVLDPQDPALEGDEPTLDELIRSGSQLGALERTSRKADDGKSLARLFAQRARTSSERKAEAERRPTARRGELVQDERVPPGSFDDLFDDGGRQCGCDRRHECRCVFPRKRLEVDSVRIDGSEPFERHRRAGVSAPHRRNEANSTREERKQRRRCRVGPVEIVEEENVAAGCTFDLLRNVRVVTVTERAPGRARNGQVRQPRKACERAGLEEMNPSVSRCRSDRSRLAHARLSDDDKRPELDERRA
jgi:hypothetical protein